MAALMMDATPLYPTLFPSPGEPAATYTFLPIHPPTREKEEEAEEQHRREEEEAEAREGGGGIPEGGVREEEKGEDDGETIDENRDQDTGYNPCREGQIISPAESAASGHLDQTAATETAEQMTSTDNTTTIPSQHDTVPAETEQTKEREQFVDRAWDEFVTHFLLGSCDIQKAAIFDLATRRPLTINGNLRISEGELEQLALSLQYLRLAYRNGVTMEGKTYKVRLADGRNGILARTESEGCTVCKTHSVIIIGVHDKRGNSRKCNEDVMRLGDFFRKKGI